MNIDKPVLAISLARKINLGNYESADCSMIASGITADMTEQEIDNLINRQAAVVVEMMRKRLAEMAKQARADAQGSGGR